MSATNSTGSASVTYTAPPPPPEAVDLLTVVSILVTPRQGNNSSDLPRSVQIRLVPADILLPPNSVPTAAFSVSQPREEARPVNFDASTSFDPDLNGRIVAFLWDFGDGQSGRGELTTHTYFLAGTYTVTLTVIDDRSLAASTSLAITIASVDPPTAAFTVTPTAPLIEEPVFFNAVTSAAATGRTIVDYEWTFSDGVTGSGVTFIRDFSEPGTVEVTLTVTDDRGAQGVSSMTLTVGGSPPVVVITHSPDEGTAGVTSINFDASGSTASGGARIVSYQWNFGDGSALETETIPITSHTFAVAGGYVVTLTVTDSEGRTTTGTDAVTIN